LKSELYTKRITDINWQTTATTWRWLTERIWCRG